MPMTIGIGTACIARRTQPEAPSTRISSSGGVEGADHLGEGEVRSAGPTSTVPGMVQKKHSGSR